MTRPNESDYNSQVAYTRALEEYCDSLAQRQARSADTWVVPDLLTTLDPETLEYRYGWNDCRQVMMEILRKESK